MRILLDTHIAPWAVTGSRRLQRKGPQLILDADEVHVSAASLWEIAIKHSLGRCDMPVSAGPPLQAFRDAGYVLLTIPQRLGRQRRHLLPDGSIGATDSKVRSFGFAPAILSTRFTLCR